MLGDVGNDYFQQAMELSVSDTMDGGAGSDAVDCSAAGMLVGRYVMIYFNASVTKPIAPSSFMVFNNTSNVVQSKLSAEDGRWIQVDLGSSLSIDAVSAQFANAPGAYSVYVGNTDMRGLSVAQLEVLNDVTVSRQDGKTKALSMKAGGIVADLTQGTVLKRYSGFVTANDRISNIENVVGTDYSDTLIGDANDNAFAGCAGNDTLMGGAGNDAYVVGLGDGQDTIIDNDNTVSNLDALIFKSGVSKEQLWFRRIGSDLEVSIIGSGDKVSIQSWYLGTQNQIERIVTSDESSLFSTDVEKMVQAMASFSPPAPGQTKLPANYQNALASVIAANWH
jgi:Ca2+-binding RTX toxin-like protein